MPTKKSKRARGRKLRGRWRYNPTRPPSIDLGAYYITMERIDTDAKIGEWLLHLAGKAGVTATDLGHLVRNLLDLEASGLHRITRTSFA